MDIDAAQYAAIAAEMVYSGEYLEIYDRGQDYLDKPPLVFWSAAAAYQILGIHPVVSKLGTLLFTLLAIYSTSRLAAFLYGGRTGQLAFYLMASVEAVFLVSNDVRTDGLLLGSVTFAMWQLTVFSRTGSTRALILGAFGAGFGMLAKGPIGVVVPVLALGSDAFLRRDWQLLFRRQWLLVPVLVLVILSPMMWGLWTQHGWGGLQFYFWTQSFGRITGERALSDSTTVVYFLHTIIWAFFPWTPVLAYALMRRVRDIEWVRLRSYTERTEFLTFGGFVLTFFALSLSQYKLPHYIYVTFPFGVIMCAQVLSQLDLTVPRALTVAQGLFLGVGLL